MLSSIPIESVKHHIEQLAKIRRIVLLDQIWFSENIVLLSELRATVKRYEEDPSENYNKQLLSYYEDLELEMFKEEQLEGQSNFLGQEKKHSHEHSERAGRDRYIKEYIFGRDMIEIIDKWE